MPELPEVETIARGADQKLRGARILHAWLAPYRRLFKNPAPEQIAGLEGRLILSIHRTGKHIVFELGPAGRRKAPSPTESQAQWIVHLGMTGRLLVAHPDQPLAAHTHARLPLTGGRELRFVDPRRFGRLEFRDLKKMEAFAAAGAEPLTIGKKEFAALFAGRKLAIKAALLHQSLLTGVGNIYADESLFAAGLRPDRPSGTLAASELDQLRRALRRILRDAIRLGGSSVSDYVDADGQPGLFQLKHRVYQRTGLPCRKCQSPIRRIVLAGRSTHYCPLCQS